MPPPLPPAIPDDVLGAQARRKIRELVEAGVSRWQAERQVAQSLTLRQLLAAEGELMLRTLGRGVARIHGGLDRLILAISDEDGEPWLLEILTPVGREVAFRPGLYENDRARLQADLEEVHRRLIDAVAQERRALDPPDDQRAIALALENLRGEFVAASQEPMTTPPIHDREEEADVADHE